MHTLCTSTDAEQAPGQRIAEAPGTGVVLTILAWAILHLLLRSVPALLSLAGWLAWAQEAAGLSCLEHQMVLQMA